MNALPLLDQKDWSWRAAVRVARWLPLGFASTLFAIVVTFLELPSVFANWRFWVLLLFWHLMVGIVDLVPRILRAIQKLMKRIVIIQARVVRINARLANIFREDN
jgi:hypothetical protein